MDMHNDPPSVGFGLTRSTENKALVAQLDRASDYESEGSVFESRRVHFFLEGEQATLPHFALANLTGECDSDSMKETRGIYKRGDTYWLSFQKDGSRQWFTLETTDFQTAIQRAGELRKIGERRLTGTLDDLRERFLKSKSNRALYSRHTGEWADTPLKKLANFSRNAAPSAITPSILNDWLTTLRAQPLAESSVQSYFRAVKSFFSWLLKEKLIHENPCKEIKLPRVAKPAKDRFCTAAQRDLLIEKAKGNDDLTFILLAGFDAGMRKMEIMEAKPSWINLAEGVIYIQNNPATGTTKEFEIKNRLDRTVPLTTRFAKFLKGMERLKVCQNKEGYMTSEIPFILQPNVPHGAALYRYDFRLPFTIHAKNCGLDWVTPHVMRHTFASILVCAGVSIYKVAMWLGDTVAVTEKHYARLLASDSDIDRGVHFGKPVKKKMKEKPNQAANQQGHKQCSRYV